MAKEQSLLIAAMIAGVLLTCGCPIKGAAQTRRVKEDPTVIEARSLIEAGKVGDAESKLAQALRTELANDSIRMLHAETLYQLGRYHFAADESKVLLEHDQKNAEAVILSGKIFQSMHNPAEAIAAYRKFQTLRPDDPRSQQYGALISILQEDLKKKDAHRKDATRKSDNYLTAVAGSNLLKWKCDAPITVFVKEGRGLDGYSPEFEESLRQAFDEWSQATDGKLKFTFIQDPATAQMTVIWTTDLHAPALTAEAGIAKTSFGANGIEKAEIMLLTVDPLKDGPVGKNHMFNVCLHEVGHALGLQGHSPFPEDIMNGTLAVQQGLSDRDIATIVALYSDTAADQRKLLDKDEWGRPLAPSILCQRHVQEGCIAAGNNQFEKAITEFEAALKIDPKQEKAREGIAIVLNNVAIEKDTSTERAIDLFHQALYWDPSCDVARGNLDSYLQSQGKDPKSFSERVKLAEQCLSRHDLRGAIVEYTEALIYKEDAAIRSKLKALKSG